MCHCSNAFFESAKFFGYLAIQLKVEKTRLNVWHTCKDIQMEHTSWTLITSICNFTLSESEG